MTLARIACIVALLDASAATAATNAVPPDGRTLTLVAAERIALENRPNLRARRFDAAAASEAVKVARASYAPQAYGTAVQAEAPGGTRLAAYNALSDPTIIARTSVGVGVSQYITDFGRTADLVQAAEAEERARRAGTERTRDSVLLDVTEAYYGVLRANALLLVANETARERHGLLHEVLVLERAGLRSTLDVAIARRDAAAADQLVLEGRNRRLDAFADLTNAIGSDRYAIYRLADIASLPAIPQDFEALEKTAQGTNPDILQAQALAQAAARRAGAATRLRAPTVAGYGFFGASPIRESTVALPRDYAAAGVNLTIPIFNGGSLGAQEREARDEALAATEEETSARLSLERDLRTAFEDVKTARGNVDLTATIERTAGEALHDVDVRYRIGLNSIVDVSAAELEDTQAAIEATNARYDFIVRSAVLQFAGGVIGEPFGRAGT